MSAARRPRTAISKAAKASRAGHTSCRPPWPRLPRSPAASSTSGTGNRAPTPDASIRGGSAPPLVVPGASVAPDEFVVAVAPAGHFLADHQRQFVLVEQGEPLVPLDQFYAARI